MKIKASLLGVYLLVLTGLTIYAQEPTAPGPKRARVPEDYQAGTLKELAAKVASAESLGNKQETMIIDPNLSPTRVRAKYAGVTARTPENKAEVIRQWANRYSGSLETYKPYEVDIAFTENGSTYWLTFTKKTLTPFWDSGAWNRPVDLFVIKMGAIKRGDEWVPVIL
ncbi:MAG TPA: hypothetical protein VFR80_00695, partial [Pyrinomonadaceae bacterium]|nr:hypothetical protein [Pyrinomonadaceae bacterium]